MKQKNLIEELIPQEGEFPAHEGRREFEGVLDNKSAYIGKSVKSFYR